MSKSKMMRMRNIIRERKLRKKESEGESRSGRLLMKEGRV